MFCTVNITFCRLTMEGKVMVKRIVFSLNLLCLVCVSGQMFGMFDYQPPKVKKGLVKPVSFIPQAHGTSGIAETSGVIEGVKTSPLMPLKPQPKQVTSVLQIGTLITAVERRIKQGKDDIVGAKKENNKPLTLNLEIENAALTALLAKLNAAKTEAKSVSLTLSEMKLATTALRAYGQKLVIYQKGATDEKNMALVTTVSRAKGKVIALLTKLKGNIKKAEAAEPQVEITSDQVKTIYPTVIGQAKLVNEMIAVARKNKGAAFARMFKVKGDSVGMLEAKKIALVRVSKQLKAAYAKKTGSTLVLPEVITVIQAMAYGESLLTDDIKAFADKAIGAEVKNLQNEMKAIQKFLPTLKADVKLLDSKLPKVPVTHMQVYLIGLAIAEGLKNLTDYIAAEKNPKVSKMLDLDAESLRAEQKKLKSFEKGKAGTVLGYSERKLLMPILKKFVSTLNVDAHGAMDEGASKEAGNFGVSRQDVLKLIVLMG